MAALFCVPTCKLGLATSRTCLDWASHCSRKHILAFLHEGIAQNSSLVLLFGNTIGYYYATVQHATSLTFPIIIPSHSVQEEKRLNFLLVQLIQGGELHSQKLIL
jgi:hypothetical protein